MWILLTAVALLAAAMVHLFWRRKYLREREGLRRKIRDLEDQHQRGVIQIQTQQETLFDSMIEGLLLLDENGRIRLANRAFTALFGVSAEIRGKTVIEALRSHELAELAAVAAVQKQIQAHELRLAGPTERWLQVNAASIADGRGQGRGTLLVFHDLTRIKQLERTRQEFVANVSHELRTPLSLIKGYVETLLDGAKEDPEIETKFLQTIQRNSERLQFLIEDLLTISELESGRIKMNLQDLPLRPVVEKVAGDLQARARTKKIALSNELPELFVRGDPGRLEQVFENLIDNAVKYGKNDGQVTVSGRALDTDQVEICVRDNGPGIPPESLERVFERFYRVDKARSREQGGTGLGLSIVKHIIQNHGGKVWVKSEPGKGAAFFFTLPKAA